MTTTESTLVKYDVERNPEVRYFLSSMNFGTPNIAELGYKIVRTHLGIKNNLHYVLDLSFNQDYMQMRNRNFSRNVELLGRISST